MAHFLNLAGKKARRNVEHERARLRRNHPLPLSLSLSLSLSFHLAPHVSVSVAAEQSLLNVEEVCRL